MCRPTTCTVCGRTTWAGCGQHVAQVKAAVPADQWCSGHSSSERAAADSQRGLLSRLFRR